MSVSSIAGGTLAAGQSLVSSDGRFELDMQGDGNLVEYDNANNHKAIWASHSSGAGAYLAVQGDANLVVYSGNGHTQWTSKTSESGQSVADTLTVQTDGNLVLSDYAGVVWASGSNVKGLPPPAATPAPSAPPAAAPAATTPASPPPAVPAPPAVSTASSVTAGMSYNDVLNQIGMQMPDTADPWTAAAQKWLNLPVGSGGSVSASAGNGNTVTLDANAHWTLTNAAGAQVAQGDAAPLAELLVFASPVNFGTGDAGVEAKLNVLRDGLAVANAGTEALVSPKGLAEAQASQDGDGDGSASNAGTPLPSTPFGQEQSDLAAQAVQMFPTALQDEAPENSDPQALYDTSLVVANGPGGYTQNEENISTSIQSSATNNTKEHVFVTMLSSGQWSVSTLDGNNQLLSGQLTGNDLHPLTIPTRGQDAAAQLPITGPTTASQYNVYGYQADASMFADPAATGGAPNNWFDPTWYAAQHPEVASDVTDHKSSAWDDYLSQGLSAGRAPGPWWNEAGYLAANPDVAAAVNSGQFKSGFQHYIEYGYLEGRTGGGTPPADLSQLIAVTAQLSSNPKFQAFKPNTGNAAVDTALTQAYAGFLEQQVTDPVPSWKQVSVTGTDGSQQQMLAYIDDQGRAMVVPFQGSVQDAVSLATSASAVENQMIAKLKADPTSNVYMAVPSGDPTRQYMAVLTTKGVFSYSQVANAAESVGIANTMQSLTKQMAATPAAQRTTLSQTVDISSDDQWKVTLDPQGNFAEKQTRKPDPLGGFFGDVLGILAPVADIAALVVPGLQPLGLALNLATNINAAANGGDPANIFLNLVKDGIGFSTSSGVTGQLLTAGINAVQGGLAGNIAAIVAGAAQFGAAVNSAVSAPTPLPASNPPLTTGDGAQVSTTPPAPTAAETAAATPSSASTIANQVLTAVGNSAVPVQTIVTANGNAGSLLGGVLGLGAGVESGVTPSSTPSDLNKGLNVASNLATGFGQLSGSATVTVAQVLAMLDTASQSVAPVNTPAKPLPTVKAA